MSILEFPRARGVKMLMPPAVGYGYFLDSPNGCHSSLHVTDCTYGVVITTKSIKENCAAIFIKN